MIRAAGSMSRYAIREDERAAPCAVASIGDLHPPDRREDSHRLARPHLHRLHPPPHRSRRPKQNQNIRQYQRKRSHQYQHTSTTVQMKLAIRLTYTIGKTDST